MTSPKLITARQLRDLLGSVSDMTVWRWLNDPAKAFPQPVYIGKRRYWREAEIHAWIGRQTEKSAHRAA